MSLYSRLQPDSQWKSNERQIGEKNKGESNLKSYPVKDVKTVTFLNTDCKTPVKTSSFDQPVGERGGVCGRKRCDIWRSEGSVLLCEWKWKRGRKEKKGRTQFWQRGFWLLSNGLWGQKKLLFEVVRLQNEQFSPYPTFSLSQYEKAFPEQFVNTGTVRTSNS